MRTSLFLQPNYYHDQYTPYSQTYATHATHTTDTYGYHTTDAPTAIHNLPATRYSLESGLLAPSQKNE